jgi:organic radical activating enzyme
MKTPVEYYEELQSRYDEIGPGFCVLKWHHLEMHLGSAQSHSCFHCPQRHINLHEDFHNTLQKKRQRKTMLDGGRPVECGYCWKAEDAGSISPRIALTPIYTQMEPDIIETTAKLHWEDDVYPKYLEMSFSNKCQMKCSYCSTQNSSTLHEEIKKYGEYPLIHTDNYDQYKSHGRENLWDEDSEMYDKFWKWIRKAIMHLRVIRVTGGEPLLSEHTFKLAKFIRNHPNGKNVAFHVNSNLSVTTRRVDRFIKTMSQMESPKIYASVDTVGEQAEWIRHGLSWKTFELNLVQILNAHIPVGLMVTFNLLSIPKFKEFLDYVLTLKRLGNIKLDTPYMTNPKHLSALILDDKMMQTLKDALVYMEEQTDDSDPQKFNSGEFQKFKTVVTWVEKNRLDGPELNTHRKDFKIFVDEHDRRRGASWHDAFPELQYFYDGIE